MCGRKNEGAAQVYVAPGQHEVLVAPPSNMALAGYVFACSDRTEDECFNRALFGGKETLRRVGEIKPGTPLLLYNVDSKELSGPYTADSYEAEHQPLAWGGAFSCQVQVAKSPGWRNAARSVTVPRGTRGLNSGPLNHDRYARLMRMLGVAGYDDDDDDFAGSEPEGQDAGQGKRKRDPGIMVMKLYHGTSVARAERIEEEGFRPSDRGCLGPGVYLARKEKAERFALDTLRHGGDGGSALVEALVRIHRPKYVSSDDKEGRWRMEGFDACRTDQTSFSQNMEWCIASPAQVDLIRWVQLDGSAAGGAAEEEGY